MDQMPKLTSSTWLEVQARGVAQPVRMQLSALERAVRVGAMAPEAAVQLAPQGPWLPARDVLAMLPKATPQSFWWVWLLLGGGAVIAVVVGLGVYAYLKATDVRGPAAWCSHFEAVGVAEKCKEEKTDYAGGTSSVAFTLASDHKTWAAVTVYDSNERFEREKTDVESGRGLRGQWCQFMRGDRVMVTVLGEPSDADKYQIRNALIFSSP